MDEVSILTRRESYSKDTLPNEVQRVICAVDVQNDRLELEATGWNIQSEQCYGIEYLVFKGDPRLPYVWDDLTKYLKETKFTRQDKVKLMAEFTYIDVSWGELWDTVADYCIKHSYMNVSACRGIEIKGNKNVPRLFTYDTKTDQNGKPYFPVGVRVAKDTIFHALTISDPTMKGYFHYPIETYDALYFAKLTKEKRTAMFDGSSTYYTYIKKHGQRNEPLDLRVYALSCFHRTKMFPLRFEKMVLESIPSPFTNIPNTKVENNNEVKFMEIPTNYQTSKFKI
jgi:phage terminase large subunit GpA-like protein